MRPFPRRDLGEGYDSEGYDVYFLSSYDVRSGQK
jgi:hypothetical protein